MFKDQDKDKDLSSKDKDKDCIVKDDQDKDCILVLKESLRTRTRTNITAEVVIIYLLYRLTITKIHMIQDVRRMYAVSPDFNNNNNSHISIAP